MRGRLFTVITICLLGILIYSNTFNSPFHFDDRENIVENISIRDLNNLQAIWSFAPTRFITYLSLACNYHFNQLRVSGYHLVNLVIHLASAILVWHFALLTFSTPIMKDKWITRHAEVISFLSGLIFVVHPIQTQGVTYIIQRTASLATFFYMASLNLYIKARLLAYGRQTPARWNFYYVLSLSTAVLGMFTKEIVLTLPLMILLYEFCFWGSGNRFKWKYLVPFLILLLIIPVTMYIARSVNLGEVWKLAKETEDISRGHYLLTQFRVLVTYLRLLFIPLNQNLDYDYPVLHGLWEIPTLASLFLLITILIIGILLFRKYRVISFTIFWFFLTLSVESGVIPIRDVIFEHRLYLPMVGYSLFLPVSVYHLCRNRGLRSGTAFLFMVVILYSFLAYNRNRLWESEFALWNDTVKKSPGKARVHRMLGSIWRDKGEYEKAIDEYEESMRIWPEHPALWNDLGVSWLKKGEYDKARECFKKALAGNPELVHAYYNMGLVCEEEKLVEDAILWYKKALNIKPPMAEAHCNLGSIYHAKGLLNEAESEYKKAIDANPYLSQAHYNLGILYEDKGLIFKAAEEFIKVPAQDTEYYSKAVQRLQKLYEKIPKNK